MKQLTMTKVLTPLAALAFAFGVQAAVPSVDGFESYAENASVTNATGWSFTAGSDGADDASFVTTYTTAGIATPATCPDGQTAGSKFLKLSTEDGMLFRNMDGANGATVDLNAGLYVDTDVQFTITDHSDQPEVTADDKFIIWLEDNNGTTNLCAWAGYYDASGVLSSNVFSLVDSAESDQVTITPNSWHRLTVKAISNVNAGGSKDIPGFQVYVDNHLFKTTETVVHNDYLSNLGSGMSSLVGAMTILPAMTSTMESLSKVGFSGEGSIDNVVVTKSVPDFEHPTTLTFNFDDTVISSVDIDELGVTLTASGSSVAAAVGQTLTMSLTFANGDADSYTVTTAANNEYATISGMAITTVDYGVTVITITTAAKDTVNMTFDWDALNSAMGERVTENTAISFTVGETTYPADLNETSLTIPNLKVNTNITVNVTYTTSDWATSYTKLTGQDDGTAGLSISGDVITITSRGDGKAKVSISTALAAAKIGNNSYPTFAAALTAAGAGPATITLAKNLTGADALGDVAIAAGSAITIDLAGKNITGAAEAAAVFSVADGGTLTITNSTVDVGIVNKGSATACISNLGTLNLQAGKFDIANGAISGGTINVTGGAYNAATFAGATLPEGMDLAQDTGALDAYAYVLAVDNSVARIAGGAKYDTLAGAITNAAAGDTVIVLKDCEVTAPIVIENGIILTNDYTISINANYALRLANGTTTPVTICGTGSIVWNGGSGSPILVGNNEATAKESYGISGIYAGSIVLNSGTICTGSASGGNMIKVENGSFVMNGGTISGNPSRCVKADAENGDTTATVTINGGVINQTDSSKKAIEAAAAGSGTATATINAGDITGKLVGLTIPGTSVARFGSDWTTLCAAGYKTVLSDGWYVVTEKVYYTAISLSTNALELVTNETYTLTATLTPASAADDSVTWTSSDDTVATVANGVVTAVGAGTATITAATANYSATCAVTVTAPSPAAAGWVDDSSEIEANTSAATQYPDLASSALATADAKELTDWAKDNSIAFADVAADTSGTYVEAFLLNCAVADVAEEKAEFKANITVNADGTVTVTAPDGKDYNGTLQLKGKAALTDAEWTDVSTPSSSYKFYKYELSL